MKKFSHYLTWFVLKPRLCNKSGYSRCALKTLSPKIDRLKPHIMALSLDNQWRHMRFWSIYLRRWHFPYIRAHRQQPWLKLCERFDLVYYYIQCQPPFTIIRGVSGNVQGGRKVEKVISGQNYVHIHDLILYSRIVGRIKYLVQCRPQRIRL